jgi:hypothetical protein
MHPVVAGLGFLHFRQGSCYISDSLLRDRPPGHSYQSVRPAHQILLSVDFAPVKRPYDFAPGRSPRRTSALLAWAGLGYRDLTSAKRATDAAGRKADWINLHRDLVSGTTSTTDQCSELDFSIF